jgi:hypothetical protein
MFGALFGGFVAFLILPPFVLSLVLAKSVAQFCFVVACVSTHISTELLDLIYFSNKKATTRSSSCLPTITSGVIVGYKLLYKQ